MVSIVAKGTYEEKPLEVMCVELGGRFRFLFDKHEDRIKEKIVRDEIRARHLIAGTYTPDENSALNVLNVLQYHFFDDKPTIETDGKFEEMPSENGVVY